MTILQYFDCLLFQGLGGSLRGGEGEKDLFLGAAKRLPILELLHKADALRGVHFGAAAARHAPALIAAGLTTAFDLLSLKARCGSLSTRRDRHEGFSRASV
jgi:hypothetical protein